MTSSTARASSVHKVPAVAADSLKALGVLAALAVAGGIPGLRWLGMLLLPGALLSALLFPEGINSDYGWTFLVLAGIADWLIAWACIFFVRRVRS
jgi:hypothetical protein